MKRGARFFLLGVLFWGWAAWVNSAAAADKVFRFRLSGDPETLDWNRAHTTEETYLMLNLMEGLLEVDASLKVKPRLAERYTVSPDGRILTFFLRPGVLWQDGVPLRAQDFEFSWRRLLSPLTAASYAYLLFDVEGAREFHAGRLKDWSKVGVRALDDRRLEVRLAEPVQHWLFLATFWPLFPMRQDVVDRYGDAWASPGKMVALGPYVLESRDLGSKVVLTANSRYWGKRGNISKIEAWVIPEDSGAVTLFEAGRLDFVKDFSPADFKRLEKKSEMKFYPYLSTHYLGFSTKKHPTSMESVRKAIAHAIDRSEVAAAIGGRMVTATGFVPPGLTGHRKAGGLAFDPLRARSLLRMAGVSPSSVTLDFLVQTSDKSRIIGEVVQAQLKRNLGIEVRLQAFEHKAFRAQLDLHAYPLFQLQWSADYPDAENFLSVFLPDSGNNRTGWNQPAFAQLLEAARRSSKATERAAKFEQADQMLVEREGVIVPLFHSTLSALVSRRSRGVSLNPLNYLFLREVSVD